MSWKSSQYCWNLWIIKITTKYLDTRRDNLFYSPMFYDG